MSEIHNRDNPVYTDDEMHEYLKSFGLATTTELSEWFNVSDVAIRTRLKDMDGIHHRKFGNKLVWYVTEENGKPGPDPNDSLRAVKQELIELNEPPVLTAEDIAERIDYSTPTVRKRLEELQEDDETPIRCVKIGNADAYWYDGGENE